MEEFLIFILKNIITLVLIYLIFTKKTATNREKMWWIAMVISNICLTYYIYKNGDVVCEKRTTFEYVNTIYRIIFLLLLFKSVIKDKKI